MEQEPLDRLLRIQQIVPGIVPCGVSTWWAWVASGKAPQPVRMGPKMTFWRESDIRAFMEKLSAVSA